jgi:Xaa-Pro dipeptidase
VAIEPVEQAGRSLESGARIPLTDADEYELRREILAATIRKLGIAAVVISDTRDLLYFTGFCGVSELGPNPFAGLASAALVVTAEGGGSLIVGEPDSFLVRLNAGNVSVRGFQTFTDLTPLRPRQRIGFAVCAALRDLEVTGAAVVGYEGSATPIVVLDVMRNERPKGRFVDVDSEVGLLRMRKSSTELAAIRRSIGVCDLAQAAVGDHARPGVRQQELVEVVRRSVEGATGVATPILIEASYGAGPGTESTQRPLKAGDLLITDIAPCVDGYWGDSCDTRGVGEAAAEQRRMLAAASEALEEGTEAVRPGVMASEVDAVMRDSLASRFPVYEGSGGHGIGLDFHEPPRLIPSERISLEPDMVIALEPGIYLEHTAVRFEHLVRVVPQGCEVLSGHRPGRGNGLV